LSAGILREKREILEIVVQWEEMKMTTKKKAQTKMKRKANVERPTLSGGLPVDS